MVHHNEINENVYFPAFNKGYTQYAIGGGQPGQGLKNF